MTFTNFLEKLTEHWQAHLPFVAYRKPNESIVKGFLQHSDELHITKDFKESGFVIAPFESKENAVLLPFDYCNNIKAEFIQKEVFRIQINDNNPDNKNHKEGHIDLVFKGIKAIKSGMLDKVVLSRQEKVKISHSPIQLFKNLLETYPTAFVFVWHHPKVGIWLGATPETLLSVENNRFSTMALAGTKVFDSAIEVSWGIKEKEEQAIVTKAIVESLGTNTENISVSKPTTTRAGNLLHLKTVISGTIKNTDLSPLLESLHPTPAVCGFPRQTSKKFILENEGYNREFYTGFLGELNMQETKNRNTNYRNIENNAYGTVKKVSNLFVNLRCMQLTNENEAILYIGGGITKDSKPEAEWQETVQKAKTIKQILQ